MAEQKRHSQTYQENRHRYSESEAPMIPEALNRLDRPSRHDPRRARRGRQTKLFRRDVHAVLPKPKVANKRNNSRRIIERNQRRSSSSKTKRSSVIVRASA